MRSALLPGQWSDQQRLFAGMALIFLLSIFAGLAFEMYWMAGIPFFLLLVYACVVDFRKVYFLLLFCIPFSIEYSLPGGFSTDLPTEPLIVGLMCVFFLYIFRHGKERSATFLRHPMTLLLSLHLGWILVTMINSDDFIVSFKFFLAKIWYVITFYFMTGLMIREEKDFRLFFKAIFIPLTIMILVAWVRHAGFGFSFKDVNYALSPFFRNHVNYASLLALFFPFVWYARSWYPRWSGWWWAALIGVLVFLIAIQLSYTRAAYAGILGAPGVYLVVRFRLMKVVLAVGLIAAIVMGFSMMEHNKYLDYAPDYNKTITYQHFDNLLEATYKGEDISTMERVYRWVAGSQMVQTRPWMGFGPGNFYNYYKNFTVNSFKTYVSDNPEHSGIHSYFMMTLVEQGFPGLILFVLLCCYMLICAENVYHRTTDPGQKRLVMMVLLSMVIIDSILLINDMVETDKVGSFFFINMAMMVNLDRK